MVPASFQMAQSIWTPPIPAFMSDEPETARNYNYINNYDPNAEYYNNEQSDEIKSEYEIETNIESETFIKRKLRTIISTIIAREGLLCETKEKEGWNETLTILSWKASHLIRPNYNEEREMDPRSYLKVKCIATDTRNESEVINGLVFTKKAAHDDMPTKFRNPKFLLIKGDLGESQFSLSSLYSMKKEKDKLRYSIGTMIDSYRPDVIIVEKSVQRDIQQMLVMEGITVILNMELHRLERISKCTDSPILSFSDFVKKPVLKRCKYFHLQQFVEEHNKSVVFAIRPSKSLMFLEGLSRPLGCTVLLKGASTEELKKIKKIMQYSVLIAYNLICETTFFKNQISNSHSIYATDESNSNEYIENKCILVLVSKRCITKQAICEEGNLFRIKYYDNYSDVSLGRYLRNLFDQNEYCRRCDESPEAHTYSYTHKSGNLNIYLENLSRRGVRQYGGIWKWIRCLKCRGRNVVSRFILSDLALNMSFGKFLELCFSNDFSALKRLSSCGHSFPQDCLLFFGMGSKVVMFKYSSVDIYTPCGPSLKLEFNISKDGNNWIKEELCNILSRGLVLFSEVRRILQQLKGKNENMPLLYVDSVSVKGISQIKEMLTQEKLKFKANLLKAIDQCENNASEETLTLNWLYQYLFLETYVWDQRLHHLFLIHKANKSYTQNPENKSWIWRSFRETISDLKHDIQFCFMEKFHLINNYTPMHIAALREDFPKENNSNIQFILGPNGNILSIYEGEISSVISCALAIKEEFSLFQSSPLSFTKSHFLTFTCPDQLHPTITIDEDFGLHEHFEYSVTCFHANHFYNLRKKYFSSRREYRCSLNRCKDWDVKGGNNKGFIAKTMDERFLLKQINNEELESFLQFGPQYFGFVSENLDSSNDSCLAKVLGIYQVKKTQHGREKEIKILMVMENIFYRHKIARTYHLKGANSYRNDSSSNDQENMVHLDLNSIEDLNVSPIHVSVKSKRLIERMIWNDTSFLTSINVMNYSLLVGIDEEKKELVYGIINYSEKYSWIKQFENWVQSFVICPKSILFTGIEPMEYKKRVRKFVTKYFIAIPDA